MDSSNCDFGICESERAGMITYIVASRMTNDKRKTVGPAALTLSRLERDPDAICAYTSDLLSSLKRANSKNQHGNGGASLCESKHDCHRKGKERGFSSRNFEHLHLLRPRSALR